MPLQYLRLDTIYKMLRKIKKNLLPRFYHPEEIDTSLQGNLEKAVLEIVPTKQNTNIVGANWLINFKNNQSSEHGEDGIIDKIFQILQPENKWVCEFGAHDPEKISNTWRLINEEGWHGVLIEADEQYFDKLKKYYAGNPNVYCIKQIVSYEGEHTLDKILSHTPIPAHLDFMVIDIDGNDYHVWETIANYQAKVVLIEFNASIPNSVLFIQPKDLAINQGSSLRAMTELARKKGYKLIAVTSWNAFFVQDQYYSLFFAEEPLLENMYVFPAKHPVEMRPFQLYDGSIVIAPYNKMLWHRIDLKTNDYQVLPETLRSFSRERAAKAIRSENKDKLQPIIEEYLQRIFQKPANKLAQFAKNYFSTYGEDGILEKGIIPHVNAHNIFLVDVGAWDGVTNSRSRHLLNEHHWQGLLLENDTHSISKLKKNNKLLDAKVIHCHYGINGELALDHIFKMNNVPKNFELLILNSYGTEYYLWESLQTFSPKIVAVQFNPTVPNDVKFIQAPDFNLHQGCSLRALCDLAHYKDYELVAVTLETAFFVKRKYFYRFFEVYGLRYAELDEIFCPIDMKLFQLYDGTIVLRGLDKLMWHGVTIDEELLQVVPKPLRKFHQFASAEQKKLFYRV